MIRLSWKPASFRFLLIAIASPGRPNGRGFSLARLQSSRLWLVPMATRRTDCRLVTQKHKDRDANDANDNET